MKFAIPVQTSPERLITATLCNAPLESCLSKVGGLPDVTLAIIGSEELLPSTEHQIQQHQHQHNQQQQQLQQQQHQQIRSATLEKKKKILKMPDIANNTSNISTSTTNKRQKPDGEPTYNLCK